uniref:Copper homeostasis protein cutC homolog n=1 Tax=Strigamia maritima TaxID=126957 RepID=T1JDQ3_STRMM
SISSQVLTYTLHHRIFYHTYVNCPRLSENINSKIGCNFFMMFLEVIATNLEDCKIINQTNNVDRIELCSNLEHGGYTPPYTVIDQCCRTSEIPIRVMTRHTDEDFSCQQKQEFEKIKRDIAHIKKTTAEGIVTGIVSKNGEIDVPRMIELIELAKPLNVTFHRAFDIVSDKLTAIKTLAELGVSTVLTQGGEDVITNNLKVLNSLRGYNVQIQGGSGINLSNYQLVSNYCDAIHVGSAIRIDDTFNTGIDINKLKLFK